MKSLEVSIQILPIAIELAQETQTIEREIDIKYREATIKLLNLK